MDNLTAGQSLLNDARASTKFSSSSSTSCGEAGPSALHRTTLVAGRTDVRGQGHASKPGMPRRGVRVKPLPGGTQELKTGGIASREQCERCAVSESQGPVYQVTIGHQRPSVGGLRLEGAHRRAPLLQTLEAIRAGPPLVLHVSVGVAPLPQAALLPVFLCSGWLGRGPALGGQGEDAGLLPSKGSMSSTSSWHHLVPASARSPPSTAVSWWGRAATPAGASTGTLTQMSCKVYCGLIQCVF